MNLTGHPTLSVNGTIEDVASFFRVSVRTVMEWKAANPPEIAHWQKGRNIMFGVEAVIELKVKHLMKTPGMKPGDAERQARTEWADHMELRGDRAQLLQKVDALADRFANLEAKLAAIDFLEFKHQKASTV